MDTKGKIIVLLSVEVSTYCNKTLSYLQLEELKMQMLSKDFPLQQDINWGALRECHKRPRHIYNQNCLPSNYF